MKHKITIETLTLAFCIALFPPIWAVIAPNINVSTGAVALICAGLYVTNGNKSSDAVKISIGFLLGDFWAVFASVSYTHLDVYKRQIKKIEQKENIKRIYEELEKMEMNKEKKTLIMRYGLYGREPMTQKEVAKKLHISRSYVSRIEKKALMLLKSKIKT